MTRMLTAAPIALLTFVVVLAVAQLTTRGALVSGDSVALWAGAIAAANGEVSLGGIVAAYPTIPFLATVLLKIMTPTSAPAPALLSAAVASLLAGAWFLAARAARLSIVVAGVATLLLVLHPALVRAAVAGPAEVLVVAFLYLLGVALYQFRARSGVPEAMAVGFALVALAFSHPMGAAIAVGSVPLLAFATQPVLVAGSALNMALTLMFPAVFATAAFCYVSWVFPGDGWNFFTAPSQSLSAWAAGFTHGVAGSVTGSLAIDIAIAVTIAIVIGAPIVPLAIGWVYRRQPLIAPAAVLASAVVAAAVLAVTTQLCGNPAMLAVIAPVLGVLVFTRIPVVRHRPVTAVLFLVLGWVGGAASLAIVDPRIATQAHAAVHGQVSGGQLNDRELAETLALGGAMAGRDGILVDTLNAPAVVVGRGDARGLLSPWGERFKLAMLFSRIESPFVAVPNPESNAGARDRLTKSFPLLYHHGINNYKIVYQNSIWRLFGRADEPGIYKD
jgi:hypothetical protein